jgi:D-3-phosphoglycerate dehydrogenase
VGLGAIGVEVGQRGVGLRMKVLGYDPKIPCSGLAAVVGCRAGAEPRRPVCARRHDHGARAADGRRRADSSTRRGCAHDARAASCSIFARAQIVDEQAVLAALDRGSCRATSATFRRRAKDHPKVVALPHLGASTGEAEENCAIMVADTLRDFLENGNVRTRSTSRRRAAAGRRAGSRSRTPTCRTWSVRSRPACGRALNIADLLNKSRGDLAYT